MTGGLVAETEREGKKAHTWRDDACVKCLLRRRETWTLDDSGAPVLTLLWVSPTGGVVRARPFPVLLGLRPPSTPTGSVADLFPGVRVGKEPKCPGFTLNWDDKLD